MPLPSTVRYQSDDRLASDAGIGPVKLFVSQHKDLDVSKGSTITSKNTRWLILESRSRKSNSRTHTETLELPG
jgi:hypothetical protein